MRDSRTNGESILSPDVLNEIFRYCNLTGKLYWKERSKELSNKLQMSERGRRIFNEQRAGKEITYKFSSGYKGVQMVLFNQTLRMLQHRVIFAMCRGEWPDVIDHIDGDKLNNTLGNLRNTNQSQNIYNSKKRNLCSSKKIGVSYKKDKRKWKAYGYLDKQIHLGYYDTEEEAVEARISWENSTGYIFRR